MHVQVSFIFSQVSREKNRFEKLMEYFINDDSNIDFMVGPDLLRTHWLTVQQIKGLLRCGCS